MACDPGKLLEFRRRMALTQEALAGKAKLNVRTVQRAESGVPIDLQTTQEIASALGVTPSEILKENDDGRSHELPEESYDGDTVAVKLRAQPNGRMLIETLSDCRDAKLTCGADLTEQSLEVVKNFCRAVRPILPQLYPEHPVFDTNTDEATRLMVRLDEIAALNEAVRGLRSAGLEVFAGRFVDWQEVFYWDPEEGCWTRSRNEPQEAVKIALVRIGPQTQPHLIERVQCNPAPF